MGKKREKDEDTIHRSKLERAISKNTHFKQEKRKERREVKDNDTRNKNK